MESATLREKADAFRRLHAGPGIFVLPNVWDVVTARVVEAAGFPALATTSAGVAWALGYPDGERISRDEMLAAVGRIARSVRVPVTADMEAGYGAASEAAAETARGTIAAGAVGLNLEDGTDDGGKLDRRNPMTKGTDQGFQLWDVKERRQPPGEQGGVSPLIP